MFFFAGIILISVQVTFGMESEREKAILGGDCFWCTEAVFSRLQGMKSVIPGYSGGDVKNPSYEEVCTGTTGHAEVVQIQFDPKMTNERLFGSPVVTTMDEFMVLYPAEDYHRDCFSRNSGQPYCSIVVAPKVKKFEKLFKDKLIKKD